MYHREDIIKIINAPEDATLMELKEICEKKIDITLNLPATDLRNDSLDKLMEVLAFLEVSIEKLDEIKKRYNQ